MNKHQKCKVKSFDYLKILSNCIDFVKIVTKKKLHTSQAEWFVLRPTELLAFDHLETSKNG